MTQPTLTFDAVDAPTPDHKWLARWHRSWPAYKAWFIARGGDAGPSRTECRAQMQRFMPELLETYDRLVALTGGSDRAARFLSTWCPPAYLGGCSLAALADATDVRLVRNYDLSPDLNEGLLLRTQWTGQSVMGMVEFLWGLSDGINGAGLSIALAYGGRSETGEGFGICTILRYVLETCTTVGQALEALDRVPSHMAYNVVIADAQGATASVELSPGGGARRMPVAIATNHQSGGTAADRAAFTRTFERHDHLRDLSAGPRELQQHFLSAPLIQDRYAEGFGTLFTAQYDPKNGTLMLTLAGERWDHDIRVFKEGQRVARYGPKDATPGVPEDTGWHLAAQIDWVQVGQDYAQGRGKPIEQYIGDMMGAA